MFHRVRKQIEQYLMQLLLIGRNEVALQTSHTVKGYVTLFHQSGEVGGHHIQKMPKVKVRIIQGKVLRINFP